jgi:hypothetical protein
VSKKEENIWIKLFLSCIVIFQFVKLKNCTSNSGNTRCKSLWRYARRGLSHRHNDCSKDPHCCLHLLVAVSAQTQDEPWAAIALRIHWGHCTHGDSSLNGARRQQDVIDAAR